MRVLGEALPYVMRTLGFSLYQGIGAFAALLALVLGAPFGVVLGLGFIGTLSGFYVAFGLMRG